MHADGWVSLNKKVASFSHTTTVVNLCISDVVFSARGHEWPWLCQVIPSLHALKVLELCNDEITDSMLSRLISEPPASRTKTEPRFSSLVEVSLSNNKLTYKSCLTIGKFVLQNSDHLKSMNLSANCLSDHGAQILSVILSKQTWQTLNSPEGESLFGQSLKSKAVDFGLKRLVVSRNKMSLRGIEDLLQAATKMSSLSFIDLSCNVVDKGSVANAFPALCRSSTLRGIDLGCAHLGCQRTPEGCHKLLLSVFVACCCLQTLSLEFAFPMTNSELHSSSRLGDVFGELIFQIFDESLRSGRRMPTSLHSLVALSLRSTGLSDAGVGAIALATSGGEKHLSVLGSLAKFDVSLNFLTVDGVLRLMDTMLHLQARRLCADRTAVSEDGFTFVCHMNIGVTTMSDVDRIYEAASSAIFVEDLSRVVNNIIFGPFELEALDDAHNRCSRGFSCREYCEEVRQQAWKTYPTPARQSSPRQNQNTLDVSVIPDQSHGISPIRAPPLSSHADFGSPAIEASAIRSTSEGVLTYPSMEDSESTFDSLMKKIEPVQSSVRSPRRPLVSPPRDEAEAAVQVDQSLADHSRAPEPMYVDPRTSFVPTLIIEPDTGNGVTVHDNALSPSNSLENIQQYLHSRRSHCEAVGTSHVVTSESVSVQPAAPQEKNAGVETSLVITAADRLAARKAKIQLNRNRRKKLLDDSDIPNSVEDSITQTGCDTEANAPSASAPEPEMDRASHLHLQQPEDDPQTVETTSESQVVDGSAQSAAAAISSENKDVTVAPQDADCPKIPQRVVRETLRLVGRVKTFTMTYTHPVGHVFCRMWHMFTDPQHTLHADAIRCAEEDLLDLLQPPVEDAEHTVETVSLAINRDGLTADVIVSTNEKRVVIAQRLQDGASRGVSPAANVVAAAGDWTTFCANSEIGVEEGEAFPRCFRLLRMSAGSATNSTLSECSCVLDVISKISEQLQSHGGKLVLNESYRNVFDLTHAYHGRESEILEFLAPTTSENSPRLEEEDKGDNSATETKSAHVIVEDACVVSIDQSAADAPEASVMETDVPPALTSTASAEQIDLGEQTDRCEASPGTVGNDSINGGETSEYTDRLPVAPNDIPWAFPDREGGQTQLPSSIFRLSCGRRPTPHSCSDGRAMFSVIGRLQGLRPRVDSEDDVAVTVPSVKVVSMKTTSETCAATAEEVDDPPLPSGPASPHRLHASAAGSFTESTTQHHTDASIGEDSFSKLAALRIQSSSSLSFLRGERTPASSTAATRTQTPPRTNSTLSQKFASELLRSTAPGTTDVSVDLLENRMRKLEKLCLDALQSGVISLSIAARNKVRICKGKILLPPSAGAQSDQSPSKRPRREDIEVTLSVEWDGLLVLKQCQGGVGGGKQLLMVHPLAYGITATMGGEGTDHKKGKELILRTSRLCGTADSLATPPSSPAKALEQESNGYTSYCIHVDSSSKVLSAIRVLQSTTEKAKHMLVQPRRQASNS